MGVAPNVADAIVTAKTPGDAQAVKVQGSRKLAAKQRGTGENLEAAKMGIALRVLKLSQRGVHHIVKKQQLAQSRWVAVAGTSMAAVLLVVFALGARGLLRSKQDYVAPAEQEEESQPLGVDPSPLASE